MPEYHTPAQEFDLFTVQAACGATARTEPDGVLRMHTPGLEVTCAECRRIILERET